MRYALAIATLLAALLLASLAQASAQEFPLDESDTGKCISVVNINAKSDRLPVVFPPLSQKKLWNDFSPKPATPPVLP